MPPVTTSPFGLPDPINPLWVVGTLTAKNVNTRTAPSTSAQLYNVLNAVYTGVRRWPQSIKPDGQSYTWHLYMIGDQYFWVAESVIGWLPDPPTPAEPKYKVDLGHMTLFLTAKEIDQRATEHETIALIYREAPLA